MIGFKTTVLTLVGAAALASVPASEASVNGRERNQRQRIQQGVRSGELTRGEAARLTVEQARLRAEEHRYRHNDGHLGPRERADLRRDLNRASRHIHRQKND